MGFIYFVMVSINKNNNNHRDLNKLDVAVAGSSGLVAGLGASTAMGLIGKVYAKKVLFNQPVMFSEEAEHFKKLQDYTEKVAKIYDSNSDLAEVLNKLKNTGKDKKEFINSAYAIYTSKEVKEASQYSDEFINLGRNARSSSMSDDELIKHSENLLSNKQLNKKEKYLLTEFLKDPSKRKEIFSIEKMDFLAINKNLLKLSLNVVIDPQLRVLANQMSDENNLKSKGVSYLFGGPEIYEQSKQQTLSNIQTQEQESLKKLESSEKNAIVKKIKTITIKIKNRLTTLKITKIYDELIKGTNAFHFAKNHQVMVPLLTGKKEAIFHELGHAINSTKSKNAGKMITFLKHKLPAFAFTSVLLSSLFLKKSKDSNKKKGIITKTREFIKNNIIILSLVISTPKLFEEGLASLKAVKFLKDKVTPQQLKNIKITSFTSWGSYGIGALSIALALKFSVWISDKIQSAKQNTITTLNN